MKYNKYLFLALSLVTASVQAETIDAGGTYGGAAGAPGTTTKTCVKVAFIKRNAGTLITGLTTAKIKPYQVIETSISPTTGLQTSKSFKLTYSLAASTAPVQAGVYDLCFTPTGTGVVWKKPPAIGYSYTIDAVVLGTAAADNGVFSVSLH